MPASLRRLVFDRARGYCEYCRSSGRFALESMELDHIIPVNRGGATIAENLASACHGCNNHKQNKVEGFDSLSMEVALLYHPRQMLWNEHFAWSQDSTLMIGLTPTGRVTLVILRLNREGVVNLRQVLNSAGKHPPD